MTLDLKAKEVESRPAETKKTESSLTDDPRTPEHPPEREGATEPSLVDDSRTPAETPHPTPSEIEAAVAQLAPEAAAGPLGGSPEEAALVREGPEAAAAAIPPTQDIGEAPPPELAPGPLAASSASDLRADTAGAMPVGAAADRLDERGPAPATTRADEARRHGAGFGSLLAASLIGGIVGAALALAAERFWLKRSDLSAARLAQIEQRLASPAPTADVSGIERRLAAFETRQREQAQQLQAVEAAAEQATKRADEALNRPPASTAADRSAPAVDSAALEPINARIAALDTELRAQTQEAAQQAGRTAEELRDRLADQTKQAEALGAQVRALAQGLDTATSQSTAQGEQVAALTQQVSQLKQQVESVSKQLSERGPETTAALRVVAADRILDALRDGAPFPQALAALKRLSADPQRLAALEPFAQSGAPTAAALAQEFRPLGERMIAEARGPVTSWQDRLARMAESIVTVRPLGDPTSDTVPGLVARIENALARSAFGDAVKAWDALPEPARRMAEEFGRKLKVRAAAEEAARTLSNQALAALDAVAR